MPVWRRLSLFLALLMFLSLAACGGRAENAPAPAPMALKGGGVESDMLSARAAPEEQMATVDASSNVPDVAQRLVIRHAQLSIVVAHPVETAQAIASLAEQMNGYVVSSSVSKRMSGGESLPYAQVTVRVPAAKLDEALGKITAMAEDVEREEITGQDVTEEFVDLKARLHNLEATRDQLQRIMDNAVNTEDVLRVYEELSRVQGEIEQVKGRMEYLQKSAAMSSIEVQISPSAAAAEVNIGGWHPTGQAKTALRMLIKTLYAIADIVIYLVLYLLPVLLVLAVVFGLPVWLVVRWLRRKAKKSRRAPAPPAPKQDSA